MPKYPPSTPQVAEKEKSFAAGLNKLLAVIGEKQLSLREILAGMKMHDRKNLVENYLRPAVKAGLATVLYPDKPNHPRQKYLLTVKGIALFNALKSEC